MQRRMKKMKKAVPSLLLSIALMLCVLLSACGGSPSSGNTAPSGSQASSGTTTTKDSLVFSIPSEPTTMDVLTAGERITYLPVHAIHDTLLAEEDDGSIVGNLVESWEVSDDGLEYTMKIREGVKFHGGQTMTVEDVIFSLQKTVENFSGQYGVITSVEKIDDTHFKFTLEYPFSPILNLLCLTNASVVCKETYEADPEGYGRNPNGTGPFKFVSWMSGENIVLERNDDWWKGEVPLKTITFRIISEEATELIALEAGDVDAYIQVSESNRSLIESNPDLTMYSVPGGQVYTLAFNNGTYSNGQKSIFADNKALRQAICYAINKEDVVALAINNSADPLYTPFPGFIEGYPSDFDGNVYNLDKAKEKLAEAGYGEGFSFTMKTTTQSGYSKPAEAIQGQLLNIGVNMDLVTMERGTYLQEVYNNFDYDATIWAVSCDYPNMDSGAYRRFYGGNISPANNYMQISDAELDDAIMTNRTSSDPAERAACVERVCEIIRDESYCLPLYSAMTNLAANSDLKGVNVNYGSVVDFSRWSW